MHVIVLCIFFFVFPLCIFFFVFLLCIFFFVFLLCIFLYGCLYAVVDNMPMLKHRWTNIKVWGYRHSQYHTSSSFMYWVGSPLLWQVYTRPPTLLIWHCVQRTSIAAIGTHCLPRCSNSRNVYVLIIRDTGNNHNLCVWFVMDAFRDVGMGYCSRRDYFFRLFSSFKIMCCITRKKIFRKYLSHINYKIHCTLELVLAFRKKF